jgi:hypothetical protein
MVMKPKAATKQIRKVARAKMNDPAGAKKAAAKARRPKTRV